MATTKRLLMYISKFRVKNYKSFLDSGEIIFTPGINIITGQNNAGKTALMQALSLDYQDVPHKSSITIPNRLVEIREKSTINVVLNASKEEIETIVLNHKTILIPQTELFNEPKYLEGKRFFDLLKNENDLLLEISSGKQIIKVYLEQFGNVNTNLDIIRSYKVDKIKRELEYDRVISNNYSFGIFDEMFRKFLSRIYLFKAERMNIGVHPFGSETVLTNNASNLPKVLNVLQANVGRFAQFNKYVSKIFPNIYWIAVRPHFGNNTQVEIVVWNEDPKSERDDLVVPLSECGTGLSQVLAILYVVLTADVPKIILIDEPNSFLHPGASRKLIEILKEYPQHQFIITTHSPSIIAASNPKTIHIIKNENAQSTVSSLDIKEAKGQQSYLAEIGAKLSDVFGADNILWVEGKTEEICFPKIIEKMKGVSQMGTAILGVKHTGDFEGKHAKNIFDIYRKLTEGKGLVPPAVGFIFDKEGKNPKEIEDLKRQSENKIAFSERKMFENYLMNPKAILEVINTDLEEKISLLTITDWIEANKWDRKYISQKYANNKNENDWLLHVDGAKFLTEMFKVLSDNKINYSKVKHSVALAEWLIDNDFDNSFDDYKKMFNEFLNS